MREASDEMRRAASDLQQQDPEQASARGQRASERLRQLEQQMRGSTPDDRRRALGDLQLETRQLADAQRRLAGDASRAPAGEAGDDQRRRLAGEQDKLADCAQRLRDGVRQVGGQSGKGHDAEDGDSRKALDEAAREVEQQRLAERMRETAGLLRRPGAAGDGAAGEGEQGQKGQAGLPGQPQAGQGLRAERGERAGVAADGREAAKRADELARALDKIAEQLGAATGQQDGESRRLSDQLARTRELRDRLADVERLLEQLGREGNGSEGSPQGQPRRPGQGQDGQSPSAGDAGAGRPAERLIAAGPGLERRPRGCGRPERWRGRRARRRGGPDAARRRAVDARGAAAGRSARARQPADGGGTPEDWRPSVSAPGTEAFKQDFAKWESLKQHLVLAIRARRGLALERTADSRDQGPAECRRYRGGARGLPRAGGAVLQGPRGAAAGQTVAAAAAAIAR